MTTDYSHVVFKLFLETGRIIIFLTCLLDSYAIYALGVLSTHCVWLPILL